MAQLNSQGIIAKKQYLAAMGVQQWFARLVLPNAKPSPTYLYHNDESIETDTKVAIDSVTSQSVTQEIPRDAAVNSAERPRILETLKLKEDPQSDQAPKIVDAPELPTIANVDEPSVVVPEHFHLNVYSVDDVVVVCECSDASLVALEQSLLGAILNAYFGRQYQPALAGSFIWPVFSVMPPCKGDSPQSVTSALEQFFDHSLSGDSSTLFVFSANYPRDTLTALASRGRTVAQVVTSVNTLSLCLNDPSNKRALWHDLVRQRAELSGTA